MPTEHDKTRIARQWAILLTLVRSRFGVTNAKLREQMGVSRHTIWRDLTALAEAGVPIEEHIENGERRFKLQTTDLPALTLLPAHVQALAVSRAMLGALEGTALLDAYDDILVRRGRPARPSHGPGGSTPWAGTSPAASSTCAPTTSSATRPAASPPAGSAAWTSCPSPPSTPPTPPRAPGSSRARTRPRCPPTRSRST